MIAETDNTLNVNSYIMIIGAIGVIAIQGLGMWLSYLRERDKIKRDDEVAAKVARVAVAQGESSASLSSKIDHVGETVDVVHKLTNSGMTEVRNELRLAREEIKALQEQRVADAAKR